VLVKIVQFVQICTEEFDIAITLLFYSRFQDFLMESAMVKSVTLLLAYELEPGSTESRSTDCGETRGVGAGESRRSMDPIYMVSARPAMPPDSMLGRSDVRCHRVNLAF
jgi:hypothetical protein